MHFFTLCKVDPVQPNISSSIGNECIFNHVYVCTTTELLKLGTSFCACKFIFTMFKVKNPKKSSFTASLFSLQRNLPNKVKVQVIQYHLLF